MSRTNPSIDQARYARWVRAAKSIKNIEVGLVPFLEGLGKIDATLAAEDNRYLGLTLKEQQLFTERLRLQDRFTMSILWVLGCYEAVRTLSQRVRTNPRLLSRQHSQRLDTTRRRFERVRVLLAKFEPSRRHRSTDFSTAQFTLNRRSGISWRVAKRVVIPRQRLSDQLLKLLETLS